MIGRDLAASRDRGAVADVLIAAEYPIYGRFGYGPATTRHDVGARRPARRPGSRPRARARCTFIDNATYRKEAPADLRAGARWRGPG